MQAQFDKLVQEFSKDSSLDGAISEALECINELNGNLDGVFLYQSIAEKEQKEKIELRCQTIEDASRRRDSFVNASFAMQGLQQILCGGVKWCSRSRILL
jgi:hypothetical protein